MNGKALGKHLSHTHEKVPSTVSYFTMILSLKYSNGGAFQLRKNLSTLRKRNTHEVHQREGRERISGVMRKS